MTFPDFIRSLGIIPPESIERGKFIACATDLNPRKKGGRIKLSEDGKIGWAWNYKQGEKGEWKDGDESTERDYAADNAARSARIAARNASEREGILRARLAYSSASPLRKDQSGYLSKKRIEMLGCFGLRMDAAGNLLVPMWRRISASKSELINVQKITPEGEKKYFYFWDEERGVISAPAKRGTFLIERPRASVTVLAEGIATGLTLFEALPTANVLVTFSAGNLITVAQHEDFSGFCVVAGDNDDTICARHLKEGEHYVFDPEQPRPDWCQCNPGKTAAIKAAKAIGCGWTVPSMETGSDFNDAFVSALVKLEEKEEFAKVKTPPRRLRSMALSPIGAAMMKAAKFLPLKDSL